MVRGLFFFHHIHLHCYFDIFALKSETRPHFYVKAEFDLGTVYDFIFCKREIGNIKFSRSCYGPGINFEMNGRWWTAVHFHIEMLLILSCQHLNPRIVRPIDASRWLAHWKIKASVHFCSRLKYKNMPSAVGINHSMNHANFALIWVS